MIEPLVDADFPAQLLGVTRGRVYQLCRQSRLPFIRISERRIKFDPRQLEDFVRRGGQREPEALEHQALERHSSDL